MKLRPYEFLLRLLIDLLLHSKSQPRLRIIHFIFLLSFLNFCCANKKAIKKLKKDVIKLKEKDTSILSGIDELKLRDEALNKALESVKIDGDNMKADITKLQLKDFEMNQTLNSVKAAETDFIKVAI